MKFILDTHTLLRWLADDERLGPRAREQIEDPANDVLVSVVSLWEIVVKMRVGKLQADIRAITDAIQRDGFTTLPIAITHLTVWRNCRSTTVIPSTTCSSPRPLSRAPR